MSRTRSLMIALGAVAALTLTACADASEMAVSTDVPAPTINDTAGEAPAESGESTTSSTTTSSSASSSSATSSSASSSSASSSSASSSSSAATSSGNGECAPAALATVEPETLTIATSEPAFEPWMVDDDPTNKQGYESAVAYAVAASLGYSDDQVTWVRQSFDAITAPTPKDFDFAINQVSITPERAEVLDFSTGYYDVTQAVVTVAGSPIADVTSLAGLKDAKLGAMLGTTSLDAIAASIAPSSQPSVFDDNVAAVAALQNGQIDGLVLDLPSAFYAAGAQLDNGVVLGQLPGSADTAEQFGLVLDKDSPLTDCVSDAVDAIRADGTLDELVTEWISTEGGAPILS